MSAGDQQPCNSRGETAKFTTTHWSVVLAAGQSSSPASQAALEQLCRSYWYPLYAYIRRRGYSAEDSQDLFEPAQRPRSAEPGQHDEIGAPALLPVWRLCRKDCAQPRIGHPRAPCDPLPRRQPKR